RPSSRPARSGSRGSPSRWGPSAAVDLVLSDDLASDDERAAVDAVLGAATSGWSGGERTEADGRVARGGREAREQRHLLLPVLHALQSSAGWISPGFSATPVSASRSRPPRPTASR